MATTFSRELIRFLRKGLVRELAVQAFLPIEIELTLERLRLSELQQESVVGANAARAHPPARHHYPA